MAWKRGNPGDPCCGPGVCECPGGGVSRKFAGTPTLVVTLSGLEDEYQFQVVIRHAPIGGDGTIYRYDVTLLGLDACNGTYVKAFDKTPSGCIDHETSMGTALPLPSYTANWTRYILPGSSGCTTSSPVSASRTIGWSITAMRLSGANAGKYDITSVISDQDTTIGFGEIIYALSGQQRLECSKDYDPTLDMRTTVVAGGFGSVTIQPRLQEFYLVHRGDVLGRCQSPVFPFAQTIGSYAAEIIDDVP